MSEYNSSSNNNLNAENTPKYYTRHQLTTENTGQKYPRYSPDGTKVVYVSDEITGNPDIMLMNSDGTDRKNLTNTPTLAEAWPSFSPDGTKIAFIATTLTNSYDFYIMDADGKNRVRLTSQNYEFDDSIRLGAFFNQDGDELVYCSKEDGGDHYDIWKLVKQGTEWSNSVVHEQVTFEDHKQVDPIYSPNGSRIAYVSNEDGGDSEDIWLMNGNGTAREQLINDFVAYNSRPDFHPNGYDIVFQKDALRQETYDIWIVDINGTKEQITDEEYSQMNPGFNNDGRKIVYQSDEDDGDYYDLWYLERITPITVDDDGEADYEKIQDAVDAASSFDVIYVFQGTYEERVSVSKPLTIVGEMKYSTVVDANFSGVPLEIDSDRVNVSSMKFANSGSDDPGVIILDQNNITVEDCSWEGNYHGILVKDTSDIVLEDCNIANSNKTGMIFENTRGVELLSTVMKNNERGAEIKGGNERITLNNNGFSNDKLGLSIQPGNVNITLKDNRFYRDGIFIDPGLDERGWNSFYSENNQMNLKPLYIMHGESDTEVPSDAGQIILANCRNVTINETDVSKLYTGIQIYNSRDIAFTNNTLSQNVKAGLFLANTTGSKILNNDFSECKNGVSVTRGARDNLIQENTFINSTLHLANSYDNTVHYNAFHDVNITLRIQGSYNNTIYYNNFYNGTVLSEDYSSYLNNWSYDGGGNYWHDYHGVDNGENGRVEGDDIGDTEIPHPVENKSEGYYRLDNHPLISPYDVTPPDISSISFDTINGLTVVIEWTASESSRAAVEYSLSPDLSASSTVQNTTYDTRQRVMLRGLQPNSTYYFMVTSEDTAGNTAVDDNESFYHRFRTPYHDFNAPVIKDHTMGFPKTGSFQKFSANVTDKDGVVGVWITYWFNEDEEPVNRSVFKWSTNYDFSILMPVDASYVHYSFHANDTYNNWNSTENRTLRVVDTIRPKAVAGGDVGVLSGTPIEFDGSASSDNIGIKNYTWIFHNLSTEVKKSGKIVERSYSSDGVYNVELMVFDGGKNSDSHMITVYVGEDAVIDTDNDGKMDWEDGDDDGDGMPDWWEEKYGLDPKDPSDAEKDPDGDGKTNLEEFNEGTDPLEGVSSEKTGGTDKNLLIGGGLIIGLLIIIIIYLMFRSSSEPPKTFREYNKVTDGAKLEKR
ncbi:MAG: NosD domain-containing protein [Thermoplasmata archaeon]